jgi:8-oxo-dGTP pyrophosphatase MutT (NUDIX family)
MSSKKYREPVTSRRKSKKKPNLINTSFRNKIPEEPFLNPLIEELPKMVDDIPPGSFAVTDILFGKFCVTDIPLGNFLGEDIVNKLPNINREEKEIKPISSYGIILFTINSIQKENFFDRFEILYLLTQRRDSISYAEFLKDNLKTEADMIKHINLMSKEERQRCLTCYVNEEPELLWDDLWVNHKSRAYKTDRKRCCKAFMVNMEKYIHEFLDDNKGAKENSWGFPKGRKHIFENEVNCALREFEEETKIPKEEITLIEANKKEEIYLGTDNKWYRTVYYIAYIPYIPQIKLINSKIKQPYCSIYSHTDQRSISKQTHSKTPLVLAGRSRDFLRDNYVSEEVSQMKWCNYKEASNKLDIGKQDILNKINHALLFKKRKAPNRRFSF